VACVEEVGGEEVEEWGAGVGGRGGAERGSGVEKDGV